MDPAAGATRHVLTRTVLALGLKGGIVVAGFGMQVILARTLGPEGLGVYATFLSLATVLSITGGFGMPMAAVRFIPVYVANGQDALLRGFVAAAQRLTLASSVLVAIGFCLIFVMFPTLRDQLGPAVAAAPIIPLFGLGTLAAGELQALGQPLRSDLLINLSRVAMIAAFVLLAGWLGQADAVVALWLTGLAALIAWLAACIAARRALPVPLAGPRADDERRLWISAGMTFVLAMAAVSLIERLDTIMLGVLVGAEAAGIYSVASRLALTVALATTSVLALMAPALARQAAAQDRDGLQRTASIAVALALLLALCVAAVLGGASPWLLPAFGPEFDAAALPFAMLLAGQVAVAACGSAGGLLALAGHNRALVVTALGAVILHMVLCLLLVPVFGPSGAAGATVATLVAQAVALAVVAWRTLGVDPTLLGALRLAWRSFGPAARRGGR
ncbi:MAG TPA: oligosaccharide flippase family protein [Roseomonas sp.]|nr:oligosaccharide flippase family protein [Roseomonas sp.]